MLAINVPSFSSLLTHYCGDMPHGNRSYWINNAFLYMLFTKADMSMLLEGYSALYGIVLGILRAKEAVIHQKKNID